MAKVLLGREKGDGFYHLHRLETLRYALKKEGHTCILAVHDLKRAREDIKDPGSRLFGVPHFHPPPLPVIEAEKRSKALRKFILARDTAT